MTPPRCPAPKIRTPDPCGTPLEPGATTCPRHAETDPTQRCAADSGTKRERARCHAWPLVGQPTCAAHSEAGIAARRAATGRQRAERFMHAWESAPARTQRLTLETLLGAPWFDVPAAERALAAHAPPAGWQALAR